MRCATSGEGTNRPTSSELRWPRRKAGRECLDRWSAFGGHPPSDLYMATSVAREVSDGPNFGRRRGRMIRRTGCPPGGV
jgi:hypothetical protein